MAQIATSASQAVFRVEKWLGLNESPDGDTTLKDGELSVCRNFKITREGHLQIRSGTMTTCDLHAAWAASGTESKAAEPAASGLWYGKVGHASHLLGVYGGLIFDITGSTNGAPAGTQRSGSGGESRSSEMSELSAQPEARDMQLATVREVGHCTQAQAHFFGFSNKLYLLNGHEYLVWDGDPESAFMEVTGYIPTITTATPPTGGGVLLENINRLNGLRRQKFSPDGTASTFQLNETELDSVLTVSGTDIAYTVDAAKGQVKFSSAPAKGVNTIEITYKKGDGSRSEVLGMRFSELYNGNTDTRVFLYGDGSNRVLYSGITSAGEPSAEYFPDLYELRAGSENTAVTSCVRHYSRLLVFKEDSAWSVQYSTLELSTSQTTPAFYVTTVNRQIGNAAPGQACLIENNPVTLDGDTAYEWRSTTSSGSITDSDRNAVRMSDRVRASLRAFHMGSVHMFNHKEQQELYFTYGGQALIYNYGNNTWYRYTEFPAEWMENVDGTVFYLTPGGKLRRFSGEYRNDDEADINAYAETGSMAFNKEWMRKYASIFYVAIKPESGARVTVTAETNRKSDYAEKIVSASLSNFTNVDFRHFSFGTNRKPQVRRIKLKIKKATFVKLIFKSTSASATATILSVVARLRYTGYVK